MTEIRELDPETVERIAAGEVVERPASAVKELVENSLDADADRVEVAVADGGRDGIRVTDDGVGMTREEVRRAVEKHTTSKITDVDDLEGGVATLGFRGEALHAIGAVSRVTITTRPRGGGEGTELRLEGGEVTDVSPAGCPEGTTVEVEDLFYNVPARRKYLKQTSTEFAHVNTVVTSYALANPDVAVTLSHDGRETFATTGQGALKETVMSVYGREVATAMIDVDADGEDLPDGPLDSVTGLVSHPETNRAGREYLSTYINGRYVRADAVREAVIEAYGTQLAPDRYPFAVLFCEMDPADIDVNVHPRKLEVRFADESGAREQVETAVEDALLREGLLRSTAPRGRSAPEQTEIAPERGDESGDGAGRDADGADGSAGSIDAGAADSADAGATETVDGGAATDPEPAVDGESATGASAGGDAGGPGGSGDVGAGSGDVDAGSDDRSTTDAAASSRSSGGSAPRPSGADSSGSDRNARPSGADRDGRSSRGASADAPAADEDGATPPASGRTDDSPADDHGRKFAGGGAQSRLGEDPDDPAASFDSLPAMRILGQYRETYVVAETDDGLVLVDQHAADERINYERLTAAFEGETTTQALAEPVELELTAREAAAFADREAALASLGFHAERTGERTVEVRTLPGVVAEAAGPELVRDVLSSFVSEDRDAAETVEAAADDLLADLACYPSITGNTSLTEGSIRDLLAELDDCENPWACPHGRPVVVRLDEAELSDRFERDYPGHTGRRE
ncbi:DNA mismatch repair endonuclease MutL [Halomicrobium salinisoli]|uniref:DNA mismatch repair endonuclease MutL n=1 Tax=Halomicrobium salinisoli TaxID=2878391 RepID=UPI001CF00256|nr:DNA mismatch repair endonuclease MutL [Halomicrobium salinisoli]